MFVSSAFAQAIDSAEPVAAPLRGTVAQGARVFPPFDFSYFGSHVFWLLIFFGLFYVFIARVIVPRIGGVIETRRDRIAADLDKAARMKQDADNVIEIYEKEFTQARAKAHVIAQTAHEIAQAKAVKERQTLEIMLDTKLQEAEAYLSKIRDKAMVSVDKIAQEAAVEIVEALSSISVDPAVVRSAVKQGRI